MSKLKWIGIPWLWTALAVSPAAAATPWPAGSSLRSGAGVQVEPWRAPLKELLRIKQAGFSTVRWGISWQSVESSPGAYNWRESDAFIENLRRVGLRSVVILGLANSIYDEGAGNDQSSRAPADERSRAAFARYAAAAASRYRKDDITWEIWNEPDLPRFWRPIPDPESYAKLAALTCNAIKADNPGAVVVGPASASIPDPAQPSGAMLVEALKSTSAWGCLNAVSAHFYAVRPGAPPPPPEAVSEMVARASDWIARPGPAGPGLPLICTEWGYSGLRVRTGDLAKMLLLNQLYGVRLTVFYEWEDRNGPSEDSERHFGLTDWDGRDKDGLRQFRAFLQDAGGAHVVQRLPIGTAGDYVLTVAFSNRERAVVAWTERPQSHPMLVGPGFARSLRREPILIRLGPAASDGGLHVRPA